MATKIYLRRGLKADLDNIVLEMGEPGWTTDTNELYIGDGVTSGGIFITGAGGVDTINGLMSAIIISGVGTVNVSTVGQNIIVSGFAHVGSLNALTENITISGGTGVAVTIEGQTIVISREATASGVDSLNGLLGAIDINGAGVVSITEIGNTIVVSGTDVADVDSINALTGIVTISGTGLVNVTKVGQNIVVSGQDVPDVDSLNGLAGIVTISGMGTVEVEVDGQNIIISQPSTGSFIGLIDVPSGFAGHGSEFVKVNATENALEFVTPLFTQLNDVPNAYTGYSGKVVKVNTTEDGLEFSTVSGVAGVNTINSLVGDTTISGAGGVSVAVNGQVIVVSGQDVGTYVDTLNALQGNVIISGVGGTVVAVDGQTITVSGGGGSSVGAFTDLTDVPSNYGSSSRKVVAVNSAKSALEFISAINVQHVFESDHNYSGLTTSGIAGETLVFGNHAVLASTQKWVKTIATAGNRTDGHIGVVVASGVSDSPIEVLLLGYIRDDSWSLTPGSAVYVSTTSGELSLNLPTVSGQFVRAVGYAKATSVTWYNPDNTFIELG